MIRIKSLPTLLLILLLLPAVARAHYLWVVTDKQADGLTEALFIFEEGPRIGDGHYLDPFVTGAKMWVRTLESPQPKLLTMQEKLEEATAAKKKRRWLTAAVSADAPRAIDAQGTFGVYRYGKTDVLLHYYAKTLDLISHEALHELGRAEQQRLDIEPHDEPGGMTLTVFWEGAPVPDRPVYVRGPGGFRQTLKTDESGQVEFETEKSGRYLIRTYVELPDENGEYDGKSYQMIRHHATLTMNLPLEK